MEAAANLRVLSAKDRAYMPLYDKVNANKRDIISRSAFKRIQNQDLCYTIDVSD